VSDARMIEHAEGFSCELGASARALFTTRAQANLSTRTGDGHERGRRARDELCESLDLQWLCASRQVHGATVQRVRGLGGRGGEAVAIDADGHATALAGVGAMVLTADCLPVAMAGDGAVAMLHAGWRGLAAGVLAQGVRALRELDDGDGAIVAAIGPGAGVCCYEVGPEVHAAFGTSGRTVDLKAIARAQLEDAGVAEVHDAGLCTMCDPEAFFSHRRDGGVTGRQAGVVWRS
jgi:YfiH family protein